MKKLANYINGADVTPISNQYIDNFNPSVGEVYSLIPDSDERDVELAYQAAEKAFETWSKTPAEKRFKILNRIAELIDLKMMNLHWPKVLTKENLFGWPKLK